MTVRQYLLRRGFWFGLRLAWGAGETWWYLRLVLFPF